MSKKCLVLPILYLCIASSPVLASKNENNATWSHYIPDEKIRYSPEEIEKILNGTQPIISRESPICSEELNLFIANKKQIKENQLPRLKKLVQQLNPVDKHELFTALDKGDNLDKIKSIYDSCNVKIGDYQTPKLIKKRTPFNPSSIIPEPNNKDKKEEIQEIKNPLPLPEKPKFPIENSISTANKTNNPIEKLDTKKEEVQKPLPIIEKKDIETSNSFCYALTSFFNSTNSFED